MKKCILLLLPFCFTAIHPAYNQAIIAGDTAGLLLKTGLIQLTQGPIPFGEGVQKSDSLDLDSDGIFDVSFFIDLCNTFDCVGSSSYLIGKHPEFSFVKNQYLVKRFVSGDTIVPGAVWDTLDSFGPFVWKGITIAGYTEYGEWLNANSGFVGFRLKTPDSDTLYGWIRVYTASFEAQGAILQITQWAIQSDSMPSPVFESIPPSDIVRIQPNPVRDLLRLENRLSEALQIEILDLSGKICLARPESLPANGTAALDLSSLPGGLYLLSGHDSNGRQIMLQKVVKQ